MTLFNRTNYFFINKPVQINMSILYLFDFENENNFYLVFLVFSRR